MRWRCPRRPSCPCSSWTSRVNGLYVHVPFCVSKCDYCDFYSLANRLDLVPAYVDAVLKEAQAHAGLSFETLYLGGGTPSLLGVGEPAETGRGPRRERLISPIWSKPPSRSTPSRPPRTCSGARWIWASAACRSAFSRFRTTNCGVRAGCILRVRRWRPCPGRWGWGSRTSPLMSLWACLGRR